MIPGRIIGIFCAVVLSSLFTANNFLGQFLLWIVWTLIGFAISLVVSIFAGININTDQPNYLDAEKYWTDKYGEEQGKEAYKMWLDEL